MRWKKKVLKIVVQAAVMNTLEKIDKLDSLIDNMRKHVAGYGEATRLLRQIKLDVKKLALPQGDVSGQVCAHKKTEVIEGIIFCKKCRETLGGGM